MSAWQDILGVAAVGTERQEFSPPPAEGALGRALSGLDTSDREGALLGAVALAALYRRAGLRPASDTQTLPEASEADEASCCSAEAGQHLALMFEGQFKAALPEWLTALGRAGRRVPAEYLPALLERGRTERGLRPLIVSAAGRRGRWLAAQNEDWHWAASRDEAGVWETGGRDERLFLLRSLRENDPRRARELLSTTWKSEAARDRQSLLETFLNGLGPEDEPFLCEALADRGAEVRRTAGELLLRLPSSNLRRLVIEGVGSLLGYQKSFLAKARIEVAVPDDPARWQREHQIQLELPSAAPQGTGVKAWWLRHAVGWVPPETWCRAWNRKPAEVLEAARHGEWKETLLVGLAAAAGRHADAAWAEAILAYWQDSPDEIREAHANLVGLAAHVPAARLEALILAELSRGGKGRRVTPTALRLLLEHRKAWGVELSRAVTATMKERAGAGASGEVADWYLKAAFQQFALYVSPDIYEEVAAGWPADPEGVWRDAAEEFMSVYTFRRDMLRAVGKEGSP